MTGCKIYDKVLKWPKIPNLTVTEAEKGDRNRMQGCVGLFAAPTLTAPVIMTVSEVSKATFGPDGGTTSPPAINCDWLFSSQCCQQLGRRDGMWCAGILSPTKEQKEHFFLYQTVWESLDQMQINHVYAQTNIKKHANAFFLFDWQPCHSCHVL